MTLLKKHLTGAQFTGLGGLQMQQAGQQRVVRAEDVAHMGITEVLRHAPFIYRQYRKLVRHIRQQKPDIAVLIDFPDVNFRLAKHLARAGVPVVWFVSPQLWAWKRGRLQWVQERVDKMLVIFPFEEPFYRERGVDAEFVGHPLAIQTQTAMPREVYAAQHALDPERPGLPCFPAVAGRRFGRICRRCTSLP
jgi:lipid-A-disaccharide synthase